MGKSAPNSNGEPTWIVKKRDGTDVTRDGQTSAQGGVEGPAHGCKNKRDKMNNQVLTFWVPILIALIQKLG